MIRSRLWSTGAVALAVASLWFASTARVVDAQDAASASPSAKADVAHGKELFDLCSYCHGPDGLGKPELGAPQIAGMPEWYLLNQLKSFRSGIRGMHPDDEAALRMRPMALTLDRPGDVESVAAYVSSLPKRKSEGSLPNGNAAQGQAFFATCMACHGAKAEGNQALNAPPLTHLGDWYIAAQLQKFRAGIRGASPTDTNGMLMRPMALSLPSEQAVLDVAAYIGSLAE